MASFCCCLLEGSLGEVIGEKKRVGESAKKVRGAEAKAANKWLTCCALRYEVPMGLLHSGARSRSSCELLPQFYGSGHGGIWRDLEPPCRRRRLRHMTPPQACEELDNADFLNHPVA